jgi:hypothetical protein
LLFAVRFVYRNYHGIFLCYISFLLHLSGFFTIFFAVYFLYISFCFSLLIMHSTLPFYSGCFLSFFSSSTESPRQILLFAANILMLQLGGRWDGSVSINRHPLLLLQLFSLLALPFLPLFRSTSRSSFFLSLLLLPYTRRKKSFFFFCLFFLVDLLQSCIRTVRVFVSESGSPICFCSTNSLSFLFLAPGRFSFFAKCNKHHWQQLFKYEIRFWIF